MRYFFILLSIIFSTGIANAQDFRILKYHFNPVMEPKGPHDILNDCANNESCKAAMRRMAEAVGWDSDVVDWAAYASNETYRRRGNETNADILADPSGEMRAYCRVGLEIVSRNSAHFEAEISAGGVRLYAVTPKKGVGKGRTWVDVLLVIEDIPRPDLDQRIAEGRCTIPKESGNAVRIKCFEGKSCDNRTGWF